MILSSMEVLILVGLVVGYGSLLLVVYEMA